MGRPPAYIFVVRHGNRLDAADKQWHLTSPTPYDPPLTYGGWMHSRIVGTRIANILQEDELASAAAVAPEATPKRRSFRVVIHSSPFLRCIQTSVAISAGLASNPAKPSESVQSPTAASQSAQRSASGNPTAPPTPSTACDASSSSSVRVGKSVLRLDAFLGEWLAPEYFEHITPPPKSALMLATAKAELLRRSSYHDYPHFHARVHSSISSQLWSNSSNSDLDGPLHVHDSRDTIGLETLPQIADSLPARDVDPQEHAGGKEAEMASQGNKSDQGYTYPVPAYALSTSEPIPRGYVAHARDACVSVDYQWDSSRDQLSWGDGGQLPEEWATMHQRFRKGLSQLVHWYNSTENPGKMVTKTAHSPRAAEPDCAVTDGDEDSDVEDVVVLVSHGAGCNALIGALTHQPVLADVAMSSITMAKRRANFEDEKPSPAQEMSGSFRDAAVLPSSTKISEMYELKLFANTDHLVAPSHSAVNRRSSVASTSSNGRGNNDYVTAPKDGAFGSPYSGPFGGSRSYLANASLGSMRRPSRASPLVIQPSIFNANTGGITIGSGASTFSNTRSNRSGSGTWGLWSPKARDDEPGKEPEPLMFLDFSYEKLAGDKKTDDGSVPPADNDKAISTAAIPPEARRTLPTHDEGSAVEDDDEERDKFGGDLLPPLRMGTNNGGLWGAPRPPGEAERFRDFSASKRRWTVTER